MAKIGSRMCFFLSFSSHFSSPDFEWKLNFKMKILNWIEWKINLIFALFIFWVMVDFVFIQQWLTVNWEKLFSLFGYLQNKRKIVRTIIFSENQIILVKFSLLVEEPENERLPASKGPLKPPVYITSIYDTEGFKEGHKMFLIMSRGVTFFIFFLQEKNKKKSYKLMEENKTPELNKKETG